MGVGGYCSCYITHDVNFSLYSLLQTFDTIRLRTVMSNSVPIPRMFEQAASDSAGHLQSTPPKQPVFREDRGGEPASRPRPARLGASRFLADQVVDERAVGFPR